MFGHTPDLEARSIWRPDTLNWLMNASIPGERCASFLVIKPNFKLNGRVST